MKKMLFFAVVLFSTTAFSQTTRFEKFQSSNDLKNEFANVKSNEKNSYYLRLLKLTEVEKLSKDPDFGKFPKSVLLSLTEVMYGKDADNSCSECSEDENNDLLATIAKLDNQIQTNQNIEVEDLEKTADSQKLNSGLKVMDMNTDGKKIYFTTSNGVKAGTYYHTYKVKKDKLKFVKTVQAP